MKVLFSDLAKAGLGDIASFIARDDVTRARLFVRELQAKAREIAASPESFPIMPRYAGLGIRRRVCRDSLIFYRVDADTVYIVHIVHGARDYEALLFPEVGGQRHS